VRLDSYYLIPKVFSDLSGLSMCISKQITWIISKSHREKKKLHFFAIYSSNRHEKQFQMLQTLLLVLQYPLVIIWFIIECIHKVPNDYDTFYSQIIWAISTLKMLQSLQSFQVNSTQWTSFLHRQRDPNLRAEVS
jgi:hypothetical protein